MKYRKRPVVVEATQWFPDKIVPGVIKEYSGSPYVVTIHQGQRAYVEPGDWIITEPDGVHHYPCKPDVFSATYDAVVTEDEAQGAPVQGYETPMVSVIITVSALPNPGVADLIVAAGRLLGVYGGHLSVIMADRESGPN